MFAPIRGRDTAPLLVHYGVPIEGRHVVASAWIVAVALGVLLVMFA